MRDALSTVQLCFLGVQLSLASTLPTSSMLLQGCLLDGRHGKDLASRLLIGPFPSSISHLYPPFPSLSPSPFILVPSPTHTSSYFYHFFCLLIVLLLLYPGPTSLPSLSLSFSSLLISISLSLCLFLSFCIGLSLSSLLCRPLLLPFSTPNSWRSICNRSGSRKAWVVQDTRNVQF